MEGVKRRGIQMKAVRIKDRHEGKRVRREKEET